MVPWTISLGQQYGDVVRIHPNELSFVRHAAWQDIFERYTELQRSAIGTIPTPNGVRPLPVTIYMECQEMRLILL